MPQHAGLLYLLGEVFLVFSAPDYLTGQWSANGQLERPLRRTDALRGLPSVALGASGKPVLLIWGEQDQTTPYAQNTRVQQALGKPQFLSVPNAGHLPHLEQPQLVEPVLLEFLQSL